MNTIKISSLSMSDAMRLTGKIGSLPGGLKVQHFLPDMKGGIEMTFNREPTELILNFIRNKYNTNVEFV